MKEKSKKPAAKSAKSRPAVAKVMTEEEQRAVAMKPVVQWKNYIRRMLNEDGSYEKKYTYQVTLTAQSLRLLDDIYYQITQSPEARRYVLEETSREGNPRKVENPLLNMYIKMNKLCQQNLAALGMNMVKITGDGPQGNGDDSKDPLMALMSKMK